MEPTDINAIVAGIRQEWLWSASRGPNGVWNGTLANPETRKNEAVFFGANEHAVVEKAARYCSVDLGIRALNGREAVLGFVAYMQASAPASQKDLAAVVDAFCDANEFPAVRDGWEDKVAEPLPKAVARAPHNGKSLMDTPPFAKSKPPAKEQDAPEGPAATDGAKALAAKRKIDLNDVAHEGEVIQEMDVARHITKLNSTKK